MQPRTRASVAAILLLILPLVAIQRGMAEDINVHDDPDIPDDYLGAAVSAKIGSNDAYINYTGQISRSGEFFEGTGWVEANVLGPGTGTVRSFTETVRHCPSQFETNGNSCQSLKPMVFGSDSLPTGSAVNASVDIHFDGLLTVQELVIAAGAYCEARVEYMAEIQYYDSALGYRDILGDNTFDGVALLVDNGVALQVQVPEIYEEGDEEEGEEPEYNTWYNNSALRILQVVSGAAGAGQVSLDDLDPATRATAEAQLAEGRHAYYLAYDQTFEFDATVGETYYMAMDLLTAAGCFGDSFLPSYACSDFGNTIRYTIGGSGLDLKTIVQVTGNEGINRDNYFGGSSSVTTLTGANLGWTGSYNLGTAFVLGTGSTNVFNVGSFTPRLSGDFSGGGVLQKTGSGRLVLAGSLDDFSGGIQINEGIVNVDTTGGNTTYAGSFSGSGSFEKAGTGRLELTGSSGSFAGTTQVNAGTLALNGTLGGDMTVASGATLQGNGILGGNLTNQGTVAPGNSIDTLTVAGNYTQAATATMEVEIDDSGSSDLLEVGGTANIQGGTLRVIPMERITDHRQYRFLTAGGAITGEFDICDTALIDFTAEKRDGDTEYWITVVSQAFSSYSTGYNETSIARYMDDVYASAAGDSATVMTSLMALDESGLHGALGQIDGELHATLPIVTRQNTDFVYNLLSDQLRAGFLNPNVANPETGTSEWTGWITGYGRGGQASSDGNAQGFNYSLGGTLLAIERQTDGPVRLGLFYNYAETFLQTSGGLNDGADVESNAGGIYLTARDCCHYFTVVGGFGYDEFDTTRRIRFGALDRVATADYHGWQSNCRLEYGRLLNLGFCSFQPFAALEYLAVRQANLAETGADSLNLNVGGVSVDGLRTILGTRLSATLLGHGLPEFDLHTYWLHELLDEAAVAEAILAPGGSAYQVRGLDVGRDWVVLGPGVRWSLTDHCRLFANYDLSFNSDLILHSGVGGAEFTW